MVKWQLQIGLRLGSLDLDVSIEGGDEPIALIGPNGCGKTTVLRTIAGAYTPDRGRIQIGSQCLFDAEAGVDLPPEARRLGYVPQGYGLFPHLTVVDNVGFGWTVREESRDQRRRAAAELLERMGCVHLAARMPSGLSGGEQQQVALARALMIEPRILLLDEPLAALDVAARRRLRGYLAKHLQERAGPALVVSHDVRDVLALKARVYVMEAGRIVQVGTARELAAQPATEFVAEFFESSVALQPAAIHG